MNEEKIAIVSHYHNKIGVTTIVLIGNLSIGDSVRIQGGTTDYTQNIDSMQQAGNHIAIEAKEYTREGDIGHSTKDYYLNKRTGDRLNGRRYIENIGYC